MMRKKRVISSTILDKLHRGVVYTCIGVTLYGTFLLGVRVYRHFTVVRPAIKEAELKIIEEGSHQKSPELKC